MSHKSIFSSFTDDLASRNLMEKRYSVHGLPVRIVSDSAIILNAVNGLLDYFSVHDSVSPEVTFYVTTHEPSEFSWKKDFLREGRVLFDSAEETEFVLTSMKDFRLRYRSWETYYMADYGPWGSFFLDTAAGLAVGFLPQPEAVHPAILSNFLFLLPFAEMFRARDYFLVHSAAVMAKGKGVIVPALSGSGKTTLCLSLLRGGFKYLSDDRPFLRKVNGSFEILSFPEDIDVTEETISLFPELSALDPTFLKKGLRKRNFRVESVYPGITVDRTVPHVLIFPQIVDRGKSRLHSLPKIEAVSRLLPHSLLVMDPDVAVRQFNVLCELVENVDCFELDYGRDVLDVHRMINQLL